mgnify:CR=1 FL=1
MLQLHRQLAIGFPPAGGLLIKVVPLKKCINSRLYFNSRIYVFYTIANQGSRRRRGSYTLANQGSSGASARQVLSQWLPEQSEGNIQGSSGASARQVLIFNLLSRYSFSAIQLRCVADIEVVALG